MYTGLDTLKELYTPEELSEELGVPISSLYSPDELGVQSIEELEPTVRSIEELPPVCKLPVSLQGLSVREAKECAQFLVDILHYTDDAGEYSGTVSDILGDFLS